MTASALRVRLIFTIAFERAREQIHSSKNDHALRRRRRRRRLSFADSYLFLRIFLFSFFFTASSYNVIRIITLPHDGTIYR